MAEWIKFEHTTPDKPEVSRIAEILDIDPDAVVGKLARIWVWADQQSLNGNAISVTKNHIDRVTHQEGFANALKKVGWLTSQNGVFGFPNFERHNGITAKKRALGKSRQSRHRNAGNVTDASPERERELDISNRIEGGSIRSDESADLSPTTKMLRDKLGKPKSFADVQLFSLVGRAVDEGRIAEVFIADSLVNIQNGKNRVAFFRSAMQKNLAAAGKDFEGILNDLKGVSHANS